MTISSSMKAVYELVLRALGEEDDGGSGGCRPGSALCVPAEGGHGGSGHAGLPKQPPRSSRRPLPHCGGLQRGR